MLTSSWTPGLPRLLTDRAERIEDQLDHHLELFFSKAAERGDLATPFFDPRAWQLLFTSDNQPLLIGAPQAALLLEQNRDPRAANGAHLAIQLATIQTGELDILANGTLLQQARIEQPGAGGTIHIPWHGERLSVEFRFRTTPGQFRADVPTYAITGIAVRAGPPPAAAR
jgi:hypothetical protein